MKTLPLILASSSPRRHELLRALQIPFTIEPSTIDETTVQDSDPAQLAETLARSKALDVARHHPDAVVIGADTLVDLDGEVLNKPRNATDAARMLRLLAGNRHMVHSGIAVAVRRPSRGSNTQELSCLSTRVTTTVRMRPADSAQIEAYVATGEPLDKAGAYAAQGHGAALIERVEGSYLAVVGLPLLALRDLLLEAGIVSPASLATLDALERGEHVQY
jgi:septum formation protein